MYFKTAGTPPTLLKCSIKYFPLGFKSAITGVLSLIACISSNDNLIFIVAAIANKCKTAFVLPPKTTIVLMAFSKEFFVMISLGLISFSNKTLR